MRLVVFGLTLIASLLFVYQFFGSKGTPGHIVRGMLIGILSLAVVIINTIDISTTRGLIWDAPFIIHDVFGTGFFVGLIVTSIYGYRTRTDKSMRSRHAILARLTAVCFVCTLVLAVVIRFFR